MELECSKEAADAVSEEEEEVEEEEEERGGEATRRPSRSPPPHFPRATARAERVSCCEQVRDLLFAKTDRQTDRQTAHSHHHHHHHHQDTRQVTRRSNGAAAEVREAVNNGFRGEQSASVRRVLADGRGRTVHKSRKSDGTANQVDTLHNMEADDCERFDSDWRASAGSGMGFARLGGQGGGGGFARLGGERATSGRARLGIGQARARGGHSGAASLDLPVRGRRVPERAHENDRREQRRGRRQAEGKASIEEID